MASTPTNNNGNRTGNNDDEGSIVSCLTMDSSFPIAMRSAYYRGKLELARRTRSKCLARLENICNHLAKVELTLQIHDLKEKVRMAKLTEQQEEEEEEDAESTVSLRESPATSHHSSNGGHNDDDDVAKANYSSTEGELWSGEEECFDYDSASSNATFDPDFFQRNDFAPPIFEEDEEDDSSSGGRRGRRSQSPRRRGRQSQSPARRSQSPLFLRTKQQLPEFFLGENDELLPPHYFASQRDNNNKTRRKHTASGRTKKPLKERSKTG